VTSGLSWRWIFFVNLPIGVLALLVTLTRVDESRNPFARKPDLVGFNTFSSALAALVFGLIRSNADGWGSTTVLGSLAAAAALLTAFGAAERVQSSPMFDLGLLRVPSFVGGLAAALAINGALFALLTYLVLYFEQPLGLSPAQAGVRFLPLTGAIFVASGIAGRMSEHVPNRLLIAPGFMLVGGGLLLMRGLTPGSTWTHLLTGMVVAGLGAGLVNVPLAATAVGVVEPARAGMASGINSTFRQVGTATGVAALGSIFAGHMRSSTTHALQGTFGGHAAAIAHALAGGATPRVLAATRPGLRPVVAHASLAGFVGGLNLILLIGATVAFAAAALTLVAIRERDLVQPDEHAEPAVVAARAERLTASAGA
jgi:predicted MFS family arabinose efflux permease